MAYINPDEFEMEQPQGGQYIDPSEFEQEQTQGEQFIDASEFEPEYQNPVSKFVQGAGKMLYGAANVVNPINILSRAQDKRFKKKKPYNENVEGLIGALRGVNSVMIGSEPTLGEIQGDMSPTETVGTLGTGFIRNAVPVAVGAIAGGGPVGAGAGLAVSNATEFERSQKAREIAEQAPRNRNAYDELSLATDVLSGGLAAKLGTAGKLGKSALSDIFGGATSAAFQSGAEGENLGDTSSMMRMGLSAGLPAVMHGGTMLPKILRRTNVQDGSVKPDLENAPVRDMQEVGSGYINPEEFSIIPESPKPDFVESATEVDNRPNQVLFDAMDESKVEQHKGTLIDAREFEPDGDTIEVNPTDGGVDVLPKKVLPEVMPKETPEAMLKSMSEELTIPSQQSYAETDALGNTTIKLPSNEFGVGSGSQMRTDIPSDVPPNDALNRRLSLMEHSVIDPKNNEDLNLNTNAFDNFDESAFGKLDENGERHAPIGLFEHDRFGEVMNMARSVPGGIDEVMNGVYGADTWKAANQTYTGKTKEEVARQLIDQDPMSIDNSNWNYNGMSLGRITDNKEKAAIIQFIADNGEKILRSNNVDKDMLAKSATELAERIKPDLMYKKIKAGEGLNLLEVGASIVQKNSALEEWKKVGEKPNDYTPSEREFIKDNVAKAILSEHAVASQSGAMLSMFAHGINAIAKKAVEKNDFGMWKDEVAPSILDKIYRNGIMRDMTNTQNKGALIDATKKLLDIPNNDQDGVFRFLAKQIRENGIPEATLAKSMYANLLSVNTFLSVAGGNAITGMLQGARNVVSSGVGADLGKKTSVTAKAAELQLAAIKSATAESMDRASYAWKFGYAKDTWKSVKDINNIPVMFRALGWSDENGISEGMARKVADTLNMPMRAVIAADEMTRTYAEKMAAITYAYQGVMNKGYDSEKLASVIAEKLQNPDKNMQDFITEAGKQAALQKELEHGSLMYWLKNAVQSSALNPHHDDSIRFDFDDNNKKIYSKKGRYKEVGGKYFSVPKPLQKMLGQRQRVNWFRPLVPFPNMTGNMFDVGLQYSPASIFKAMRTSMNMERGAKIDKSKWIDQISKGAIGSVLMGFGLFIKMQLGGNEDPKMQDVDRAMNIPYDSVGIFDKGDMSLQKLGPAATPIVAGWFARQLYDAVTATKDDLHLYDGSRTKKGVDAAFRSAKTLSGVYGLEGSLTAANALDGNPGSGGRVLGAMISPYIPASGTSKMINALVDKNARKGEGLGDSVLQSLPLGSFLTPKRVSPLGDEQQRPSRLLSSFGISVRTQDPVYRELHRLGVPMDSPTKTVSLRGGEPINMTQDEMNSVNAAVGSGTKEGIKKFMESEEYTKMSDDQRRQRLLGFFKGSAKKKSGFKFLSLSKRDKNTSGVQESFDKASYNRQKGYR